MQEVLDVQKLDQEEEDEQEEYLLISHEVVSDYKNLKIKKLMLLNVFQELGQLLLDHLIEAGIAVGSFLLGLLSRQKKNK